MIQITEIGTWAIKLFAVCGIILIGYLYIKKIVDQNNLLKKKLDVKVEVVKDEKEQA